MIAIGEETIGGHQRARAICMRPFTARVMVHAPWVMHAMTSARQRPKSTAVVGVSGTMLGLSKSSMSRVVFVQRETSPSGARVTFEKCASKSAAAEQLILELFRTCVVAICAHVHNAPNHPLHN
jgi:hypothetical protein